MSSALGRHEDPVRIAPAALAIFFAGALTAVQPAPAGAYAVAIHELMPREAFAADRELSARQLPAVGPAELNRFRLWLDGLFRNHPDPAVAARYRARWPKPENFDARALKALM